MSLIIPKEYNKRRSIQTLIENRTTFSANNSELHVFETGQYVKEVSLTFNDPVIASMLKGEKRMRVKHYDEFRFLPGESIILPGKEEMLIEFPEATLDNPTQCTALTVEEAKFIEVLNLLNEVRFKNKQPEYDLTWQNLHFTNSMAFQHLTNRLMFLFMEDHPCKDHFIDLTLQELIMRLVQSRQLNSLDSIEGRNKVDSKLREAIEYIDHHLTEPLQIETISKKAYMSVSNFYKLFRNEFDTSPTDYINRKRVELAAEMIQSAPHQQLKEIFLACGFTNYSYFHRTFKKFKKISPSQFQERCMVTLY